MFKVVFLLVIFFTSSLFGQSVLDDKVQLKDENFVKSVENADTIILGKYVQGGKTKAKVMVDKVYVGEASGDIEISGLDNEKIRLRYKREAYKKGDGYVFILKKGAKDFKLLENGVFDMRGMGLSRCARSPWRTGQWRGRQQRSRFAPCFQRKAAAIRRAQ